MERSRASSSGFYCGTQLPDARQVVVIVLCKEKQMVHKAHLDLQPTVPGTTPEIIGSQGCYLSKVFGTGVPEPSQKPLVGSALYHYTINALCAVSGLNSGPSWLLSSQAAKLQEKVRQISLWAGESNGLPAAFSTACFH